MTENILDQSGNIIIGTQIVIDVQRNHYGESANFKK